MRPTFSSGFTANDVGDDTAAVEGNDYDGSPRLNAQVLPTNSDCIAGLVGREYVVIGQGGYYCPRS